MCWQGATLLGREECVRGRGSRGEGEEEGEHTFVGTCELPWQHQPCLLGCGCGSRRRLPVREPQGGRSPIFCVCPSTRTLPQTPGWEQTAGCKPWSTENTQTPVIYGKLGWAQLWCRLWRCRFHRPVKDNFKNKVYICHWPFNRGLVKGYKLAVGRDGCDHRDKGLTWCAWKWHLPVAKQMWPTCTCCSGVVGMEHRRRGTLVSPWLVTFPPHPLNCDYTVWR